VADTDAPLSGLVVVERGRRLATAAAGNLLASLGARVLRLETPDQARHFDAAPLAERMLRGAGKQRIVLTDDPAETWQRCHAMADVLLLDPPAPDAPLTDAPDAAIVRALLADAAGEKIVCVISPSGLAGGDAWRDVPEPLLQAVGGCMSVTGHEGGPPEFVRIPVVELSAAVVAASAVLAALRVRRRDGIGQLIDLSLIEVAADQLRIHLPLLELDGPHDFRQGCRHPICTPWNVYRATDGWVLICSTSDAQWHALLDLIGHPELKQQQRYARNFQRRALANEVDVLLQEWVGTRSMHDVVASVGATGVPSGEARSIPQVLREEVLRQRGTVHDDATGQPVFGGVLGSRKGPTSPPPLEGLGREADQGRGEGSNRTGLASTPPPSLGPLRGPSPQGEGENVPTLHRPPTAPLSGIRVIEITRYTAGPLAGMLLASLGAEVIKIESPGGEETRRWKPQHGGASGYFINHNAGKRSVVLDLRLPNDQHRLAALVAASDVLLQNLRPGVMEQIGLGAAVATQRYPRLVHATISGFGLGGPELPALDTVIQGLGGLTSLIGTGESPCRMGMSIADQSSGQFVALAILAALTERERSGRGRIVDIAMCDAIAWLTQLAWPDGHSAIGPCVRWPAQDGWVAIAATEQTVRAVISPDEAATRTRNELVEYLARHAIQAAPVLEPAEVFAQPVIRDRRSIHDVVSGDDTARILAMPFGLTAPPARRPRRMHALGEDNAALLPAEPTRATA